MQDARVKHALVPPEAVCSPRQFAPQGNELNYLGILDAIAFLGYLHALADEILVGVTHLFEL